MSVQTLSKHSDKLREMSMPVWRRILEHPFLRELQQGVLPIETFRYYIRQDWLYLQERVGAWTIMAGRCPDPAIRRSLASLGEQLLLIETASFHAQHATALGIDFSHVDWEMNEANWAYTTHQYAAAYAGSTAEGLAALLPCPMVYGFVGHTLIKGPMPSHPVYADWIDFYGSGRGDLRRSTMIELYDSLMATADPDTLARCERNFLIGSRYEWYFWDAAYRRQTWPGEPNRAD